MSSSPVDEVVRNYAKYPSHLAEKDRLEAIKATQFRVPAGDEGGQVVHLQFNN